MEYFFIFIILLIIELVYFKIADRYNIIDKPNSRSSHSDITLRGGGVIFPIGILAAFFLGYISLWITLAVVIVAIISFIDDISPLKALPRFSTHILAVLLVLYDLDIFHLGLWLFPILLIILIGWINIFNFMDGINGITVLFSLVLLLTLTYLQKDENDISLLITMIISCLVFGFFNIRKKAKTFAGDVGSVSMGLFLGYFLLKTILETEQIGFLLLISVYGIDGAITILQRLIKKENIFEAHRSHLYQYLVNEYKYSHVLIAVFYAGVQLIINVLVIYMYQTGCLSLINISIFLILLILMYIYIKAKLINKLTL